MATVYTRAAKGSALTWTEGDANITNLNTAKIENVVEDTTPQLGGDLDVNGKVIASVSNGNIAITPNGTGSVIIDGNAMPQDSGIADQVLITDGAGQTSWSDVKTIHSLVYNADSVTINKGQPVYLFGASGANPSVKLAANAADATSATTYGLANENIAAGATGSVVTQGLIKNVNTSSYSAGDILYLGATAGTLTTTKPYAPNHLVYIGVVTSVNAVSGRILVKVQNGYELDEIHNVNINHNVASANKDYLVYNSSNDLWENRQLDIVNDTTPQLGGNLDVNGNSIVSTSNGNITLAPNGTGKVIINGTLQVDGTTTTINSTVTTIDDPVITLGGDTAPSADDNKDRGIEFRWHNGTTAKVGFFGFDDSTGYLTFIPDATNTSEVFSGTQGDIQATNFRGNLVGNADSATYASAVSLTADNTTNATNYPLFVNAATGNLSPRTDTAFTFNPSTGALTTTSFVGSLTGNADSATYASAVTLTADNSTNATNYLLFANAVTGNLSPRTDTGLTYNPSTNTLTATTFSGALSGNATTATSAATLTTARAIYGNNFDGSAALTQIIASTYGGTGNGFTKFTGPTTAERTFTLPDASSTIVVQGGALGTPSSGTVTNLTGTASININGTVGATTANTGAFTTLSASSTVSGTGFSTYLASPPAIGGTTAAAVSSTTLTFKEPREAIYDNGNSGTATITPNAANGSVQKYTLTGNITWNAFGTPVAGQSMTVILVQDGTGGKTLTSTMKWAGGSKTLSTAANSIDIATVYYDGTNYYASLSKGFA